MNKKLIKIAILMSGAALITTVFGVACGNMQSAIPQRTDQSSLGIGDIGGNNTGGTDQNGGGVDTNTGTPVIPAVKSAGVPILSQAYASLTGALQVATPSAASRDEYNRQVTNLSESGRPSSIGSSYAVAYSTLGAQLCLDRITTEINQQAAQKVLFNEVNLSAAPANNANEANLSLVINRLARALWQRNETAAERQILIQAVNDSMALDAGNNANETQEAALFLCTAMLSSSAGMQL